MSTKRSVLHKTMCQQKEKNVLDKILCRQKEKNVLDKILCQQRTQRSVSLRWVLLFCWINEGFYVVFVANGA